jgi:hypothetical protein
MTSNRIRRLRECYGFDFPDDFFRFWVFVNRLRPLEPLTALDALSIQLVGPFEILAGRFDGRSPPLSLLLHWRYYLDPPEFFSVLAGSDGQHWGYYLDAPPGDSRCVTSYFAGDAFEMSVDGDDLFAAVRLHLEEYYSDCELDHSYQLIEDTEHEESLAGLTLLRDQLMAFGTGERRETGAAYVDRYAGRTRSRGEVLAETIEGMGIVVPPAQYRPLSRGDAELWPYLCETDDPADMVAEARQALSAGFPGTALKLGKDLWAIGGERHTEYAYELLDSAYAALGHDVLHEVLRVHRANRNLPSVDILENEQS